ncbi:hypothetical protein LZ24_01559 [Desulfobotulus alkaliphilus]|uniref:DUF2809 domain-containing protein n=1 Tax=Desulfobotulus alkaliphilus TaxID=622671 RepID=A0A562RTH2_9BACT|nr:hypothetical protein [Desulfobotulus alkaliphilus]TWI72417.1 hypothetical protein LZ24_01559 [Desulfobotulus alkaliphilus]
MKPWQMILTGILGLALGSMVYILDRPVGIFSVFGNGVEGIGFGSVGDWLPDALHPFGMALISAGFAGGRAASLRFWAVFWGIAGLIMETGQYYGERAASLVPESWSNIPVLDLVIPYFVHGTFDPMDIMGIVLGSASAWLLSISCKKQQN